MTRIKQYQEDRLIFAENHPSAMKKIQEVITLVVFTVFAIWFLKEPFRWNYLVGFVLLVAAVYVIFKK